MKHLIINLNNQSDENDKKLIEQLTKESGQGKSTETFALALIHEEGDFTNTTISKKTDNEILELYEQAAKNGNSFAQYNLAYIVNPLYNQTLKA